MPEMTDSQLRAVLAAKIQNSLAYIGSDPFSIDRTKAEQYYKGEQVGVLAKPGDGQSGVVSRDVAEAVDALMPSLLKIFASGDEVVRFEPTGPEDEAAAEQATDYVNYIWNIENNGFLVFHSWFKDALLKRLGTIKIWWDPNRGVKVERYKGLTEAQYKALSMDEAVVKVEITAQYPDPTALLMPPQPGPDGQPAQPPEPATLYDCKVTTREAGICCMPVPPDELLLDRRLAYEDGAAFMGHRRKWTVSELIEDGFDPDQVKRIAGDPGFDLTPERTERFQPEETLPFKKDDNDDPSQRELWVVECYVKVDYDGDGVAELRKITVAGEGSQLEVLRRKGDDGKYADDNEEVDDHPFASITFIPTPHKLVGMSIYDKTKDLQEVKSILWRQALNSLYLALQPQIGAVEGKVNLDDLLNRRMGGVVRMKDPTALVPIATQEVSAPAFNMISYVDTVREARTGVRRFSAGPGADALHSAYTDTATGVNAVDEASDEMILYFARVAAETGVKRAFRRILELVCQYQDKPKTIRLRNQWVDMDPREWSSQMDMTVQVGLGTGNKQQQLMTMNNLLQIDQNIIGLQGGIDGPIVTGKNVYNKLKKLIEASGLKSVESYYTDPDTPQMQQVMAQKKSQPNPEVQKAQAQLQLETQKAQHDAGLKQQQMQADIAMKQAELELKRQEAEQDMALERAKFAMQMEHDRARFQMQVSHDQAMRQMTLQHTAAAGQQKLDFAAQAAAQRAEQAENAPKEAE